MAERLEFGLPLKNEINSPLRMQEEPLRAEGNLSYLDFIELVKGMWAKTNPQIPIVPTQSKRYAKYPVITYGLELRKPFVDESKARYRNEHKVANDGSVYIVTGQRFTNIVKFTAITDNDPYLCEQIIEMFEDWMDEWTKVFKRLGVSEMTYARRLPDDEGTRQGSDVCERAVTYMVRIEKLHQTSVSKLDEMVISARIFHENRGIEFNVTEGETFLYIPEHEFGVGDRVTIYNPKSATDLLPPNIHHGWTYEISAATENTISLIDFDGDAVDPGGEGNGRIYLTDWYPQPTEIEDLYQSATPSS